jgi:ribosome-associated protein
MLDLTKEFIYRTSRSGGPGGQNVNKVSSKVELRFHVNNSEVLSEEDKALVHEKLGNYISQEGYLQITCQTDRSQLANKEQCIEKFYALLGKAFTKQKARKATKPSKASQRERIAAKKKLSDKKANRSRVHRSDD